MLQSVRGPRRLWPLSVALLLVASLARPGGNVTGLSNAGPDASGKRLELLKEVLPRVSRVAVWPQLLGPVPPHCLLRRQNPQRRQACRSPRGTAHQV